jgi:shikimate dehydrogenase
MKKLFAVIGDPIAHSMSPQMHNDLFQYYALDAHYQPLLVKRENLKDAILGFKAIGISGFNVTIPHKTNIIPYLDVVDPLAEQIGAVNTVVNQDGQLIGYNTDGIGFLTGLSSLVTDLTTKNVLVVGAGGAARAIFYSLAKHGVQSIDICNRTTLKAEELVLACSYKTNSKVLALKDAENQLHHYDIIIQTTNIGMSPNVNQLPISLDNLSSTSIVSDIIYNPLQTKLLLDARGKGGITQNGIDMFVHQGAIAFEYWTGISPDIGRMKKNVLVQLGGNIC